MSGVMSVTGEGAAPVPTGCAMADHVGALTLALGIVSALLARQRTGRGQIVETSLLGSMLAAQSWELTHYLMTGEKPGPARRGHNHLLWQWWTYRTADGWLALGGVDPSRWEAFCRAIQRPDLADERWSNIGERIRDRDELNALLDEHLSTRKTQEWLALLEPADIFCAPVLNYEQVAADEQVAANGYIASLDHPRTGPTRVIACPIAFSDTPADSTRREPKLGEHTQKVVESLGA